MRGFKENILNPAVNEQITKIESALKIESARDKVEHLIRLKSATNESLRKIARRESWKAFGGEVTIGLGIVMLAFLGVPEIMAVGAALVILGGVLTVKKIRNSRNTDLDRQTLATHIDQKIFELAALKPQEVSKVPRFLDNLRDAFLAAAKAHDDRFASLRDRVIPVPKQQIASAPSVPAITVPANDPQQVFQEKAGALGASQAETRPQPVVLATATNPATGMQVTAPS